MYLYAEEETETVVRKPSTVTDLDREDGTMASARRHERIGPFRGPHIRAMGQYKDVLMGVFIGIAMTNLLQFCSEPSVQP